jgi:hypothetical protein
LARKKSLTAERKNRKEGGRAEIGSEFAAADDVMQTAQRIKMVSGLPQRTG